MSQRLFIIVNNITYEHFSLVKLCKHFHPNRCRLVAHRYETMSHSVRHLTVGAAKWQSHYELLGISEFAKQEEIKAAYFKKSRECHPDLHPDDKVKNNTFVKLNQAYTTLQDPVARKEYDFKLHSTSDHYVTSYPSHYWRNNFHQYDDQSYANPPKTFKTKNYIIVLCLCGLSVVSIFVHYFMATVGGEIIRNSREDKNKRLNALHKELMENARKNGAHKQLLLFLEQHRQSAIVRKDTEAENIATSLVEKVKREKIFKRDQDD